MKNIKISTNDNHVNIKKVSSGNSLDNDHDGEIGTFLESSVNCRHNLTREAENIVILQGGGSLGAFGCGVLKGLLKKDVRLDIICGTSVGALNGAIFVGNKNDDINAAENLENFWMEIAESSYNILPDVLIYDFDMHSQNNNNNLFDSFGMFVPSFKKMASSPLNSAVFGVPKMFVPRWSKLFMGNLSNYGTEKENITNGENMYRLHDQSSNNFMHYLSELNPFNWSYLYDHSPLKKTLDKYIDYKKLSSNRKSGHESTAENEGVIGKENTTMRKNTFNSGYKNDTRLIITAVNVMTSEPLTFDSFNMAVKSKHLLACCGYPLYGFPWIEVEKGVYGWDGSLLNNTPLREVTQASPRNDKNIFIVENYPRKIDNLPRNMVEVLDRARDIIFSDKTKHTIKMSKIITRQIQLIEDLYDVFENADQSKIDKETAERIKKEYERLVNKYGAEILSINRITKDRVQTPNMLKNADFSPKTVRKLIDEGERKGIDCINKA